MTIVTDASTESGTTGTISIKFSGTESDSELFPFKTGLLAGSTNTEIFELYPIGTLANVYLEIDSPDDWKFTSVTVQFNGTIVLTTVEPKTLAYLTTPFIWLKGFFFFFLFFFGKLIFFFLENNR